MRKKNRRRQLWPEQHKRIFIEVTIILMIWSIIQSDPYHLMPVLAHLLAHLS
jgi:hypothetical protein